MNLYLDASALVKRYVAEQGTDEVMAAMDEAEIWSSCRISYVETLRAVHLTGGPGSRERFLADWPFIDAIEVGSALAEHAAELAVTDRLRSLDALHLAAALAPSDRQVAFASWGADLAVAARRHGLTVIPEA